MGLIAARTETWDVPGEDGAWIKLRPLTGPQMDEAKWRHLTEMMRRFEGVDLAKLKGQSSGVEAPSSTYDRAFLVDAAFVEWSYGALEVGTKPSELLDAATFALVADKVEEMNVRPPQAAPQQVTP